MHVSQSAQEFSAATFDYIVVGGGNAGLPLAVRLAENPHVKVGVLEAGPMPTNDILITQPRLVGQASGKPNYDWCYKSDQQPHAGQRSIPLPRGKGLSGTTLLNFMAWDRASKTEYDSWKSLSDTNGGWDWDSLLPYFKKSENASSTNEYPNPYPGMSLPDAEINWSGVPKGEEFGYDGPVKTSYNTHYTDVIGPIIKGFNSIGVPTNANADGGETIGVKNVRRAVDIDTGKRVTAASAYLDLVKSSNNFHVLTNATVTKLIFNTSPDVSGNHVVGGVEFSVDGEKYTVSVSKEVILSCGAVQTPQVLELSGIGQESLLKSLGIPNLINLPGVGENLQDHVFAPIQFLLKPGHKTFDEFRNNPNFVVEETAKYESSGLGWMAATDSTAVYNPLRRAAVETQFASLIESVNNLITNNAALTPLQVEQYKIQLDWLKGGKVPNFETIVFSKGLVAPLEGRSYFIMSTSIQQPFSRGSIHITTADPHQPPSINPNYLGNDIDVELLVAGFRLMEKVAGTTPLQEIIEAQTLPPVPLPDDHLKSFIRQAMSSGGHLMGTAPMARRELGGVVDNNLKVYGTHNLRVADASIIPIPIATHIQATVYAIGEKAADLIKKDIKQKV